MTSTRPYLIRAIYEWCVDNGLTPHIAVAVDETVRVPREYVRDGKIVLNISADATSALRMGNEFIEFKARFGGVARDIVIPVGRAAAVFARENGQGMVFPDEAVDDEAAAPAPADGLPPSPSIHLVQTAKPGGDAGEDNASGAPPPPDNAPPPPKNKGPALKRIK
ncbi:MAG: ClpXP protease specificity-enhancing factor [Burkholderiaceae bacterium]|nr:ClpXP protease specificity-enhancing factor [Burkholderiaceae bacterium]